jgi:hypothetical protein
LAFNHGRGNGRVFCRFSFHKMIGFSTQIAEIIFDGDPSTSMFLKPIRYADRAGRLFEIPYCQPTDFASIPKEFWGAPLFLIPFGWYSIPAGGHDALFQNTMRIVNADGTTQRALIKSESECNDLLLEMMQSIKPNPTIFEKMQMDAIYEGVTIGGWHAFKADRT